MQLVCGVCMPMAGYKLGRDVSDMLRPMSTFLSRPCAKSAPLHTSSNSNTAEAAADTWAPRRRQEVLFVSASWIVAAVLLLAVPLTGATTDGPAVYAVLAAPSGGIVRLLLGHCFNGRPHWSNVPVGTLLANICAVVLLVIVSCEVPGASASEGKRLAFKVIAVGVCGALSTVSAWVHESYGLLTGASLAPREARHRRLALGYGYYLGSVVLCGGIAATGRSNSSCA